MNYDCKEAWRVGLLSKSVFVIVRSSWLLVLFKSDKSKVTVIDFCPFCNSPCFLCPDTENATELYIAMYSTFTSAVRQGRRGRSRSSCRFLTFSWSWPFHRRSSNQRNTLLFSGKVIERRSTMAFRLLVTLFLMAYNPAYALHELTAENYDKITEGKTVFLKFYAPTVSIAGKLHFIHVNEASA